jgi:hypothetical protein
MLVLVIEFALFGDTTIKTLQYVTLPRQTQCVSFRVHVA